MGEDAKQIVALFAEDGITMTVADVERKCERMGITVDRYLADMQARRREWQERPPNKGDPALAVDMEKFSAPLSYEIKEDS